MTDLIDDTTPRLGSTTPLPKIISVDDHIVEPAHLWDTWLPERYRDSGPKAERRGIGDMEHIGGGTYRQWFDPDGPQADCWVYEDLVYINKRHVAAVGFDREDMRCLLITYDEMRPGCYDPEARLADMEVNWVEAQPVLPERPSVLRPDLPLGRTRCWPMPVSRPTTTSWSRSGAGTAGVG